LYADAAKIYHQNSNSQNGAQKFSAQNSHQIANKQNGEQTLRTQKMVGKMKCEMNPKKTEIKKGAAGKSV
jgi:hypothetical protein